MRRPGVTKAGLGEDQGKTKARLGKTKDVQNTTNRPPASLPSVCTSSSFLFCYPAGLPNVIPL